MPEGGILMKKGDAVVTLREMAVVREEVTRARIEKKAEGPDMAEKGVMIVETTTREGVETDRIAEREGMMKETRMAVLVAGAMEIESTETVKGETETGGSAAEREKIGHLCPFRRHLLGLLMWAISPMMSGKTS